MIEIKDLKLSVVNATKALDEAGIYDFLKKKSVIEITARVTKTQLDLVSAIELAIGCYDKVYSSIEQQLDTLTYEGEDFRKRRAFANRYGLFIGSQIGLQYLHNGEREKQRSTERIVLNFKKDNLGLTKDISTSLMRFLSAIEEKDRNEEGLKNAADLYLQSLKNTALEGAQQYEKIFTEHPETEYVTVIDKNFKRFSIQKEIKKGKKLSFDDYAGQENIIKEFKKVAMFIKDPHPFKMWGSHTPRGFVLVGPGGTGKTYLGRVFADECGLPFYSVKISDIVNEYYGKSSRLVDELLNRPGVIFMDEMESIGRKVGDRNTNEATEQIVNTMKDVMDGVQNKIKSYDDPITFYMGATNNIEVMEPALIRPGRLKPLVMEDYGKDGLAAVYTIHERNIAKEATGERKIFDTVNPEVIGEKAKERGFVPADIEYILQSIVTEKAYEQAQAGVDKKIPAITEEDIVKAIANYEKSEEAVIKSVIQKI